MGQENSHMFIKKLLLILVAIVIVIFVIFVVVGFWTGGINRNPGFTAEEKEAITNSLKVNTAGLTDSEKVKIMDSLGSRTNLSEKEKEAILSSLMVK